MIARLVVLPNPPRSFRPRRLLSRQQFACASPLAATLMRLPASVANKRLANLAKPFTCNTYKKQGGTSFKPKNFSRSAQRSLQFLSVPPRLCGCPVFSLPYALPSSVSCNPFVCHSYENTRGCGGILPISELFARPRHSSLATIPDSLRKTPAVGEGRHFLISQTPSQCLGASAAFPLSLEPQLAPSPRAGCLPLRQSRVTSHQTLYHSTP
jgi:hypothetical protein